MKCDTCKCKNECGYYESSIKPIQKAIMFAAYDDDFSRKIEEALEEYECEYFK